MHTLIRHRRTAVATAIALAAILAWDASGLDLWLAGLAASSSGFPARHHWLLTTVLHDGARLAAAVALVALIAGTIRPFGALRELTLRQRLWLLAAVIGAMVLIAALKRLNASDCPWSLSMFGGSQPFVSHWDWRTLADGSPGHCFPAGHASAGFAWLAGWFAWPPGARAGRRWLAAGLVAGTVFGLAQQLRGAHFMSHTLWTAWICWTWAWALSAWRPQSPRALAPDAPAAR